MKAVLGQRLIASLKAGSKPFEVRDQRLKGLLLRVQPSGAMTYYLEIRRGRRMKIGTAQSITVDDAREAARNFLAAVYTGKDPAKVRNEAKRYTFIQFIEKEYGPWASAHLRTYDNLIERLKSNCTKFHNKLLGEITPEDFEKWRTTRLNDGRKNATVNRDLDDLRSVLTKAVEWKYLSENPLRGVKKLKVDRNTKIRYLTIAEKGRLLATLSLRDERIKAKRKNANDWRAARGYPLLQSLDNYVFGDHLHPMVIVSLHTGIRQGELFDLHWSNVDFENKLLTVAGEKSKTLQTRHIKLNDVALQALLAWRDQSDLRSKRVFPGADGERLDNIKSAWKALLKAAEISKFRWHDLRHTFASWLVMCGVNLNTVRELMGHSDYQMTLRYAHLSQQHKDEAVKKLVELKIAA